ncbi:hypothetical protein LCGC14_0384590 [marine sediment metagenome]|uniref:Uncharacterized protein n=1 Tax=marine sediment metagenome TaxID=412755 RepID=A0A0F9T1C4_9ZZZZ
MGIGIGLAQIAEGLTGGAVRGTAFNLQRESAAGKQAADEAHRAELLGIQKRILGNQEEQAQISRTANAMKTAYAIAKDSPNAKEVFASTYKQLDPTGQVPEVSFEKDTIEINFEGLKFKGKKGPMIEALGIIAENPEASPEIMSQLVQLGLLSIEAPKDKPGRVVVVPPGHAVLDEKGVVSFPAGQKGVKAGKGVTVSELSTGINAIFKKYKVDAGLGITFGPDKTATIDMATFLNGKETAFNIIQKKADEKDADAVEDLAKIQGYYELMDRLLRRVTQPPPSGALGRMAGLDVTPPPTGSPTGTAPTDTNPVFDPTTGRFSVK